MLSKNLFVAVKNKIWISHENKRHSYCKFRHGFLKSREIYFLIQVFPESGQNKHKSSFSSKYGNNDRDE